ncbi:MAG: SIS domain-containing protein [Collinsella sp.]
MNAHDLIADAIAERAVSIASSGCLRRLLIDLLPAHELLKREATTFASEAYTAREFDIMRPKRLGESPLSSLAATPATPRGNRCVLDRQGGATVIVQTDNAGSGIDNGEWTCWVYPWGEGVPQAEVPAGISLALASELLDQQEGYADLADMYEGIAKMDQILPAAREKVNAELCDRFAALCQDHKFLYILGSGPVFSQAYGFAICSHGDAVAELRLYPLRQYFRPLRGDRARSLLLPADVFSECRAMDERALAFLETHTDTLMVSAPWSTAWTKYRQRSRVP